MKYFILILFATINLNSTVKRELTYLVKSSDDKLVDTLVVGLDISNEVNANSYFSYSVQGKPASNTIFSTFIRKESDYGFYFQLPSINKLEPLKLFAPALYPRNLKVGESIEDIPLPDIEGNNIRKRSITFSKEDAGNFIELSPEEKAEFIQNLGKSIIQEEQNESIGNEQINNVQELDIIADYKILDNIYYENPAVNDFVTVLESTSRSPKGEFKSVYYYHERIGFVYLAFMYTKVKYEVLLNGISTVLVKE